MAALVHRGEQLTRAQQTLADLFEELLTPAAAAGRVREDVAPAEPATFCLHSLAGVESLPSEAAVRRLVT